MTREVPAHARPGGRGAPRAGAGPVGAAARAGLAVPPPGAVVAAAEPARACRVGRRGARGHGAGAGGAGRLVADAAGAGALVTPTYAGRPFQPRPLALPAVADAARPDVATAWRGRWGSRPTSTPRGSGSTTAPAGRSTGCTAWWVSAAGPVVGVRCGWSTPARCTWWRPRTCRTAVGARVGRRARRPRPGGGRHGGPTAAGGDTADADEDPDLTTVASHDLRDVVPASDCVMSVQPGRLGHAVVGDVRRGRRRRGRRDRAGACGGPRRGDLDAPLGRRVRCLRGDHARALPAAARWWDVRGFRGSGASGAPRVAWRAAYDRGSRRKPGQPSQGSGTPRRCCRAGWSRSPTTPTRRCTSRSTAWRPATWSAGSRSSATTRGRPGARWCRSARGGGPNYHGYAGPLAPCWAGRRPVGWRGSTWPVGSARCGGRRRRWRRPRRRRCRLATGLLYTWTKPHSWWGADAWYLTAIDVRTGRTAFRVRAGLGWLRDSSYGPVTLAPDGTAYVGTLGGLVRVRDRS